MKKIITLAIVSFLMLSACSQKSQSSDNENNKNNANNTVEFRSPKGDIIAVCTVNGTDTTWVINNALGEPLMPDCEHIEVATNDNGQPKEAYFHHKGIITVITFWENMEKMAEGDLKDGLRNGLWTGYDMNTGKKMSETDFTAGVENGSYVVYNENGTPSIVGQYKDGEKTGTWTFYDKDGNRVGTQKF